MKFVLVLAVLFVALYLWRKNRRDELESRAPKDRMPRFARPVAMQRCAHCGLHLPEGEALPGPRGAYYCSTAHLQAGDR